MPCCSMVKASPSHVSLVLPQILDREDLVESHFSTDLHIAARQVRHTCQLECSALPHDVFDYERSETVTEFLTSWSSAHALTHNGATMRAIQHGGSASLAQPDPQQR